MAKVHGSARQEEKDDPFVQHEVVANFTKEEILEFFTKQYSELETHSSELPG